MRIYWKLIIIILALVLTPLFIISCVNFYQSKSSLEKDAFFWLNNIADERVGEIEQFFAERKADVAVLGLRNVIKTNLPVLIKFSDDPSNPAYIAARNALDDQLFIFQNTYKYVNVMLTDSEGRIIYVFDPEHNHELNKFMFDKAIVSQKNKTGIYIEDIHKTGHEAHSYTLCLNCQVSDEAGNVVGTVCVESDMNIVYEMLRHSFGLEKSGETLLVSKSKDHKVMFLSPLKYDPEATLTKEVTLGSKFSLPAQKAALGESGSGLAIDYRGKTVLFACRPIPLLGWGLVTKVDQEEAFASIYKLRKILIGIFLVVIFLMIMLILIISKVITNPIIKVRNAAIRMGEGNLDTKIEVRAKDEIGELAASFNSMAESLKQKQKAILTEKYFIENIISSMIDSLVVVTPNGLIQSVNKAAGDLLGYKEEELIGKEAGLIFEAAAAAAAAEEILNEIREPAILISKGFKILRANKAFAELSGFNREEIIGQFCYKVTHNRDSICQPPMDICPMLTKSKSNEPCVELHTHFNKEGNPLLVSVVAAPILDSYGKVIQYLNFTRNVEEKDLSPRQDLERKSKLVGELKEYACILAKKIEQNRIFGRSGLAKLIEAGSVRDMEGVYVAKSGKRIPVNFYGSVMYDATAKSAEESKNRKNFSADSSDNFAASAVAGIVCVARDMRHTKALIANLETAKGEIEEWSKFLEKKVQERTKDLEQSQEATLNIMEDLNEEKEKVTRQSLELLRVNEELELFSKGLEEKVKERTMELSILYEVSNAISYTLDYQTLLKLIMESLFKIVDYDVCGALLFDAHTANITLRPAYSQSAGFGDEVKNRLIEATSTLIGEDMRKKIMNVYLIPANLDTKPEAMPSARLPAGQGRQEERQFNELRSFFNAPFIVRGNVIGMINVSSCKDNAFTEDDVKLIYSIASQASNAIERLQAVLTAEKSKMESMVESMIEGVLMTDERGEIVVMNPQARRMFGFGLDEEVTSKALNEKLKVVDLDKAIQEGQDKKRLITKEIIIPGKENQILHCEITPVKAVEGEIIGIVAILRDITKEKEIDTMKTEFISTVSHELRTPLVGIGGVINNILQGGSGNVSDKVRDYLRMADNDIRRLDRLICDLLDYSRIEKGKLKLSKNKNDIINLLENVLTTLMPQIKSKRIILTTHFFKSPLFYYVDGDKITQVFTNLIHNAVKFTPEGGNIHIDIKYIAQKRMLEIKIADSGAGISPENIPKLFKRFVQIDRKDGAGAKGTGLGLAICKGIIDAHGGSIRVESEPGRGSNFIFTIPEGDKRKVFEKFVEENI